MEDKKVLLSIKDLQVKFHVRGRILTAIRGISLDIYENESIAIVGESGSGKSVFTKTFAGMLDSNGFIGDGSILFNDESLAETYAKNDKDAVKFIARKLDKISGCERASDAYRKLLDLESEKRKKFSLSDEETEKTTDKIKELTFLRTEAYNLKQTIDSSKEKERYKEVSSEIVNYDNQIKTLKKEQAALVKSHRKTALQDTAFSAYYKSEKAKLTKEYKSLCKTKAEPDKIERNLILAKEIYLSVARYSVFKRIKNIFGLVKALKKAMLLGADLTDDTTLNAVFDNVVFRVKYVDETKEKLHGLGVLNLAKVKYYKDWSQIRGKRIATVFQDPMTSLNPIITVGKQITSIILKHQDCSEAEARVRAMELMKKVGIPNAEKRFDDYPFQYSGGMRQRIVIAIALSCQPKVLICDEPTTALDVTIQAQILKLLKDLQKEFKYTIVFITHDLGVVANIADRVAVLYAGQIVEVGTVEEVFYDPRHPYTWALMSSLPQLAQRNTKLYSISGTPPSLYNKIVGDPFAPRNPYCLKVDTLKEPPMFKVSDTHYAKTWLLDPRAPKVEKPEIIQNIHEKLINAFNI
ncbi:MAG: ATP-binding cassette domain-containing protein [Clostridia bacterium]|nr:ATP-binding cassette domain-containing protein [Clostridia bacterium]